MSSGLPFKHSIEIDPVRIGEERITVTSEIDLKVLGFAACSSDKLHEPAFSEAIRTLMRRNESRLGALAAKKLAEGVVTDRPVDSKHQCPSCGWGIWSGSTDTQCSCCGAAF